MIKYDPTKDIHHVYLRPRTLLLWFVGALALAFISYYYMATELRSGFSYSCSLLGMALGLVGALSVVFRSVRPWRGLDRAFMIVDSEMIDWELDFILFFQTIFLVEVESFYIEEGRSRLWARFKDRERRDKLIASPWWLSPQDIEELHLILNKRIAPLRDHSYLPTENDPEE